MLPALASRASASSSAAPGARRSAAWIRDYFFREVMPVLTPIGLDPAHPFPRVLNKSLNFAIELEGKDAFGRSSGIAIVQAPRVLPRVIRLPEAVAGAPARLRLPLLGAARHVGELFSGMNVKGCYQFRVTRNSDLWVDEEEIKNLRLALQGELPQRHFGDAVRLEVADSCSEHMTDFLLQQFALGTTTSTACPASVNLVRLMQVPDQVDRPDLKFPPFQPACPRR
jgi:polyphosphate kinase